MRRGSEGVVGRRGWILKGKWGGRARPSILARWLFEGCLVEYQQLRVRELREVA